MKKTIALLLCLVMCVFAFASCDKKNNNASTTASTTSKPASTAEPSTAPGSSEPTSEEVTTLPPHVHTRDDDYSVIEEATCSKKGSRAILCTECGEPIKETIEEIDINPNAHKVDDYVTVEATVLGPGSRTGTCTLCGQPVEEVLEFKPKVVKTAASGSFDIKKPLLTVLDGEHFYPTDLNLNGMDLYFEIDVLWNETITNNYPDNNGIRFQLANSSNDTNNRDNLFLLAPKNDKWGSSDAKAPGGFDYGWAATHAIVYGPMGVNGTGTNAENFPNIGAYGWHRIGVQFHQEAEISGQGVAYSALSTLYVDGEKVWQISYTGDFSKWIDRGLLLFTATNEEGVLSYADPAPEQYFHLNAWDISGTDGLYIVFGDVSCKVVEPDFAPEVEKVETPEEATFVLDNNGTEEDTTDDVTCPAAIYFQLKAE